MKYLRHELPILIALAVLGLGFALEHAALEHGGAALWGLLGLILAAIIGVALRISHHAEVLAVRLGEPYGTLILTLAGGVGGGGDPGGVAARRAQPHSGAGHGVRGGDAGHQRHPGPGRHRRWPQARLHPYNLDSANSFIAMLLVAIGIGMFIPDFVPDSQWRVYSAFSVAAMALMYMGFLRLQTVEHRNFFEHDAGLDEEAHDTGHSPNGLHIAIMLGAIVLVGLLSEVLSVLLDAGLAGTGLPKSIPAVLVALISASPEILTALRAAQANRMQTTVNIALGASLATVLLTLPVIEAMALFTGERIVMALTPMQGGMLLLTLLAVMNNLHDGETNAIEGISHFALFAAFVALVMMGLL
jgi:Ca2+:H+ antiporter